MKNISTKAKVGTAGGVIGTILATIFAVEGGFVNHPSDPGGATNYGITEKVARAHGYTGNMSQLPQDLASEIYFADYIRTPGFDAVLELSSPVAQKLIDAGVNTGPKRPSSWFQHALNSLNRGGRDYADIRVDGAVGEQTLTAFRSLQRARGEKEACVLILKLLDAQQAVYYMSLTHLQDFTVGWVTHRIGNIDYTDC